MDFIASLLFDARDFLRSYAGGRGMLSLCVIATSWIGGVLGFGLVAPAIVAASGAILLNGLSRLRDQHAYEDGMLNLYRDEIAKDLGRSPQSLTRRDLLEAAKTNDVLAQALRRQHHTTSIAVASELVAAVVTVASIGIFNAVDVLKDVASKTLGHFAAYFVGIGTVSGISSFFIQNGVEAAIGQATGVNKASAHDRIMEMQQRLEKGIAATPEKVYGVLVAGEPKLAASIAKQFHKPYAKMNPVQQQAVIEQMGVSEAIRDLTQQINSGATTPGKLAYLMGEEHHHLRQAVKKYAEETHNKAPAHVTGKGFVERLGLASRANASHRSQVEESRMTDGVAQDDGYARTLA
jgi:hypothetical protein